MMNCDGPCMRSFHCGVQILDKAESPADDASQPDESEETLAPHDCNPLGMPQDLYIKLKNTKDILQCPNCLAGVQQCFVCKKEGVVGSVQTDPANKQFGKRLVFRSVNGVFLLCQGSVFTRHRHGCERCSVFECWRSCCKCGVRWCNAYNPPSTSNDTNLKLVLAGP